MLKSDEQRAVLNARAALCSVQRIPPVAWCREYILYQAPAHPQSQVLQLQSSEYDQGGRKEAPVVLLLLKRM